MVISQLRDKVVVLDLVKLVSLQGGIVELFARSRIDHSEASEVALVVEVEGANESVTHLEDVDVAGHVCELVSVSG